MFSLPDLTTVLVGDGSLGMILIFHGLDNKTDEITTGCLTVAGMQTLQLKEM